MEKAIKIAIENGYKDIMKYCSNFDAYESETSHCEYLVILDPLFWKALGKGLGWEKWYKAYKKGQTEWQSHMHRFIDHLAEEKDIEDFFNNLTKNYEKTK